MSEITPEERRKRYRDNQDYFSGKISELARYIGFGLVAVSFGLLSSDSLFATSLVAKATMMISWAGLLGCGTIIADYLHLLMGWLRNSQAANNQKGEYKLEGIGKFYGFLQDRVLFYTKQILPLIGSVLILISISKILDVPHF
ncbi:MAG: hypothetical protein ACKOPR_05985 [Chakrabartia godavariana]